METLYQQEEDFEKERWPNQFEKSTYVKISRWESQEQVCWSQKCAFPNDGVVNADEWENLQDKVVRHGEGGARSPGNTRRNEVTSRRAPTRAITTSATPIGRVAKRESRSSSISGGTMKTELSGHCGELQGGIAVSTTPAMRKGGGQRRQNAQGNLLQAYHTKSMQQIQGHR